MEHFFFITPLFPVANAGDQIDGLVQERRNSIANALELRLSCTNPSKFNPMVTHGWLLTRYPTRLT